MEYVYLTYNGATSWSASCSSSYSCTKRNNTYWTIGAPSTGTASRTISIPDVVIGCTVETVTVTWSDRYTSGTRSVKLTNGNLTNANIKALMSAGQGGTCNISSFKINYSYKATSHQGTTPTLPSGVKEGTNTFNTYWDNMTIRIGYIPRGKISFLKDLTNESGTKVGSIAFGLDAYSLSSDETTSVYLSIDSLSSITDVEVSLEPTALGSGMSTTTYACSLSKGQSKTMNTEYTFIWPDMSSTVRVSPTTNIIVKVYNNGTLVGSCTYAASNLITSKVRNIPEIDSSSISIIDSAKIWDGSQTLYQYFAGFISSKSNLTLSALATCDTAADKVNVIKKYEWNIGPLTFTSSEGTINNVIVYYSGDNDTSKLGYNIYDVTIKAIDSYGLVGTYSFGSVKIWDYTAPSVTAISLDKYKMIEEGTPSEHIEIDDDGNYLLLNCDFTISKLNNKNKWSLLADLYNSISGTPEFEYWFLLAGNDGMHVQLANYTDGTPRDEFNILNNVTYEVTLTLHDQITTIYPTVTISKSGGLFNVEPTGVAVGQRSKAPQNEPWFEVNMISKFYHDIYVDGEIIQTETGGWTDLKPYLTSGFTQWADTDPIRVKKIGSVVYIEGGCKIKASLSGGSTRTILTLPSKFRPDFRVQAPAMTDTRGANFALVVNPDGTLVARNTSNSTAIAENAFVSIHCSYCL